MEWLDYNKIPLNQKKDTVTFENGNLFDIHTQIYRALSLIKELSEFISTLIIQ